MRNSRSHLMMKESDLKKELTHIFGSSNVKSIEYAVGGTEGLPDCYILSENGDMIFCELKAARTRPEDAKFRPGQLRELHDLRVNGRKAYILCLLTETQEISIGLVSIKTRKSKLGQRTSYHVAWVIECQKTDLKELLFRELGVYFGKTKKHPKEKRPISRTPHHKNRR